MQQSSATPKNKDVGRGLWKIVACSQPYLAVLIWPISVYNRDRVEYVITDANYFSIYLTDDL